MFVRFPLVSVSVGLRLPVPSTMTAFLETSPLFSYFKRQFHFIKSTFYLQRGEIGLDMIADFPEQCFVSNSWPDTPIDRISLKLIICNH